MPTVTEVNVTTGVTTNREMTSEEIAVQEASNAVQKEADDAAAVIAAQVATDKASGNSKLKALGLTDAEITALVG